MVLCPLEAASPVGALSDEVIVAPGARIGRGAEDGAGRPMVVLRKGAAGGDLSCTGDGCGEIRRARVGVAELFGASGFDVEDGAALSCRDDMDLLDLCCFGGGDAVLSRCGLPSVVHVVSEENGYAHLPLPLALPRSMRRSLLCPAWSPSPTCARARPC